MDFGLKGRELLQDLKRSDWLPLYNEDAVSRCLQECQGHMAQIRPALAQEMTEVPPEYLVALTVHLQHILRNKRCLLAYMQYRLDKVRDLRWETGGAIIPTRLQRKLSAKESEFFASYDKILSDYMGNYPLLDLTGSTLPPKEICIEVRVLADCGEIMTDQGPVNLERGTNHFLRRADVEGLIRQGFLLHIAPSARQGSS
ncbi:dna replication complex gins protein psf1 [Nannochloropsis gaditana]|uniref:Dna replication complex gins protein psf1 n=1 Tax=Nannochloropsis gaditana TaxID=72520 RepID=W7TSN7_9STRA|nr:dna replication complex gins protein psf1 [Nannochloropsis gaditana]